jgi:hypothetical protein
MISFPISELFYDGSREMYDPPSELQQTLDQYRAQGFNVRIEYVNNESTHWLTYGRYVVWFYDSQEHEAAFFKLKYL